ncbi:hypothetical protein CORC01_14342 [Colletotrichum orchidophilum]|uniref:Uncharacterized protein n=1 Tax=Colletotrichum orchidophilum TaxID=1209926 RepID=A0A1G4AMV0_9PEZI|nr:uncharacterized protein CORC01_14342 [Colletotrichum orchidophilum]OHE90362.1 hypothetical protein CORC01_14342 [Colletotrichum orchidophilum]
MSHHPSKYSWPALYFGAGAVDAQEPPGLSPI